MNDKSIGKQQIREITRDDVIPSCIYVKSPAKQATVQSSNPGSSDGSSSSVYISQNRGQPTYCPSGLGSSQFSDPSIISDILSTCNPVTVSQEVVTRVQAMISTSWPSVTDEATNAIPAFAELYKKVKSYNLPNCLGAKVPVSSGLKIQAWVDNLVNYHDNELCHFLAYGWPIGYDAPTPPLPVLKNHPSAIDYPDHVRHFISTEKRFEALEGPIHAIPFKPWSRISPLMTRPKRGTHERRVIVDLSFPEGAAVNSGIDTSVYLGTDISFTLPTISDLIAKLQTEGPGAYIWKADLARAYRQLRSDPVDAPLLCIQFDDQIFIDRCPPFGCRSSSAACQRVANAIVYMMANNQHHCLAYLDDFAGCSAKFADANDAFVGFKALAKHLGLQLSEHKCVSPVTKIEWLGYLVDTKAMTIAIPKDKLEEVVTECGLGSRRSE